MHDYSKICRVCMASGSRDIFHRSNIDPNSPLERLLEKMRYVTMMKIEENDDLPRLICDLCIVQLNVAYNFKRQAVENDTKLRQYFIEHGITSHHSIANSEISNNSNIINQTSSNNSNSDNIIRSHNNIINSNAETASVRSTFTPSNSAEISSIRRITNSFPIMPIIVKTEPENDILTDDLSDSVLENNVIVNGRGPLTESTISTGNIISNSNRAQLNNLSSSMVYLNGYNINTLTPSSEVESYHNTNSNNVITNDELIQLSSGSSTSLDSRKNESSSNSSNSNKRSRNIRNNAKEKNKTLSPAEITRKRIAQKRLGGQLKTRRILPDDKIKSYVEKSLSTLRIDMAPPSGKISREEMKKKIYFGRERKQPDSAEKSKSNENRNTRYSNENPTILFNPFNTKKRNSLPANISTNRKDSNQKTTTVEKSNQKVNKSNQTKSVNKSINISPKRSVVDLQKSQIKLIKPKIEPSSKN